MANTFYPTQVGSIPTGTNQDSRLIFGRSTAPLLSNGSLGSPTSWEGPGFGQYGRPDHLQQFEIFLSAVSGYSQPAKVATVLMDVNSMWNVMLSNPAAPQTGFFFSMREVSICEIVGSSSVERKMMILASQTYPTGAGGA